MRILIVILAALLMYGCTPEPMEEETVIGKWQLLPDDRIEKYDIEIIDFLPSGNINLAIDQKPYGSIDFTKGWTYKIEEWEGKDAIWLAPAQNFYQWMYPEITTDTLRLTEIRGEQRTFRYFKIK